MYALLGPRGQATITLVLNAITFLTGWSCPDKQSMPNLMGYVL